MPRLVFDLIDTLWNVKPCTGKSDHIISHDLIDTLWNVKGDLWLTLSYPEIQI